MKAPVFKKIATHVDVGPVCEALSKNWDLWDKVTARQDTPGSPHKHTKTILLRWAKDLSVDAAFTDIKAVDYPALKKLPEALPLIQQMYDICSGREIGRAMFIALKPGGFIEPHIDEGDYADYYTKRCHLSLKSEPGNRFFVEREDGCGEFVHMQEGEIWWFDHKKPHWVINNSDFHRIHLVVDVR